MAFVVVVLLLLLLPACLLGRGVWWYPSPRVVGKQPHEMNVATVLSVNSWSSCLSASDSLA
jgi:hypothetical protein